MTRYRLLIALLFLMFSCKKGDKYPDIALYGHGANGIDIQTAPYQENTLEAIDYALSFPEVVGVELDIQWSKEGTAWLFHDEDLSTQTNQQGCIRSMSDILLEEVKYQGIHGEHLPRLNEVAEHVKGRKVILDVKNSYGCDVPATSQQVEESFLAFKNLLENTEVAVIVEDLSDLSFYQSIGWKVYLNAYSIADFQATVNWEQTDGIVIRNESVSAEEVAEMKALGKEVIIFEAKAPKPIRKALKKQPTMFLADDIRAALIEKTR